MSYEVSITPQAQNDLRSIYEYIAFDLQSPQNAASQLERLEEHSASLDELPERYRVYDKEPWRSRYLYILPVDNNLVFYIPNHRTMRNMWSRLSVSCMVDGMLTSN